MTQPILRTLGTLVLAACSVAAGSAAQDPLPPPKPGENPVGSPVRVQVVIARYQGEKRISSLPYTLFANALPNSRSVAQVRMGAEIPIAVAQSAQGDASGKTNPVSYDRIGTEIDCFVRLAGDGRFLVELTVSDRTIYTDNEALKLTAVGMNPTLRSYRAYNAVVLRDGQSTQFPSATDRMTGEVVRIEVTLNVVK